ncbi:MAG: hypothetical protein HQK71_04620, partial [Desulfamplus sp.]|nr:hypothetical protein [Desulfamplus sp.]
MAKIFLESGDNIRVLDNANIIGKGSTYETVRIMGTPSVTMDANIDRVEFTGNISQYTFEVLGTSVIIRSGGSAVATFGGMENIVTLAFADGSAPLELKGLSSALLGTLSLSTLSGGSALTPSLNLPDKSTVGDYVPTTDDPPPTTATSISIDEGSNATPKTLDASTTSFKFIEDPTKANNVEITNFSSDDVIELTQNMVNDYFFTSDGSDVLISYNNTSAGSDVVSQIKLVGVLSSDVIVDGTYAS